MSARELSRDVTVRRLADEAQMSRSHFSRRFREAVGVPPVEYLQRRRLREAAARLLMSPDAVAEIAADAGYDDPAYFARAFRKYYGTSPRGFRGSGMYRQ